MVAIIKSKTILKDTVSEHCDRMKIIQGSCKRERADLMSVIQNCENETHKECPIRKMLKENFK